MAHTFQFLDDIAVADLAFEAGVVFHRSEIRLFQQHDGMWRLNAVIFGESAEALGMEVVYDVAHNIAKVERYPEGELVVHRKGATRELGPGSADLPLCYRVTGQPVICGGSMETGSYVLAGTEGRCATRSRRRCMGPDAQCRACRRSGRFAESSFSSSTAFW